MLNSKKIVIIILTVVILTAIILLINILNKPTGWSNNVGVITTKEGTKIPLPRGFKDKKITNKINEGIVIEDKKGNQFVWIPVTEERFTRETFGGIITVGDIPKTNISIEDKTTEEYKAMEASVKKYGGFYIGRYESSYESGNNANNYIPSVKPSNSFSEEEMKYEKGTLWNWITFEDAVSASHNMYKSNNTVKSHLMYGVEYDTVLKWLISSGAKTSEEVLKDSSSWGNTWNDTFSGTEGLGNTGSWEQSKANNIYDLSGNLRTYSQEKEGKEENVVIRGNVAYYYYKEHDGEKYFANAVRVRARLVGETVDAEIKDKVPTVGFRICLYVK